jgi:hypothetical protein
MRAALLAMQDVARRIHAAASVHPVVDRLAALEEVFRILGEGEFEDAERRYLPPAAPIRR